MISLVDKVCKYTANDINLNEVLIKQYQIIIIINLGTLVGKK